MVFVCFVQSSSIRICLGGFALTLPVGLLDQSKARSDLEEVTWSECLGMGDHCLKSRLQMFTVDIVGLDMMVGEMRDYLPSVADSTTAKNSETMGFVITSTYFPLLGVNFIGVLNGRQ